jgi:cell division protein ZipA
VAELRWILLGLGLLLIAGIWIWGRRRSAAVGDETTALVRGERHEPHFDSEPAPDLAHEPGAAPDDLPTVEVPVRIHDERRAHGANPPVVTIDDLPENVEDVVLVDADDTGVIAPVHAEPRPEPRPARVVEPRPEPRAEARAAELRPVPPAEPAELADNAPHEEPPTETIEEPTLSPDAAVAERPRPRPPAPPLVEPPLPPPPATSDPLADTLAGRSHGQRPATPPAEPPQRHQRIVAIRLIAVGDQRIDGGELKAALAAERLVFGRYSIFHRLLEGDRPLYSVASLVEPGSFDPALMASVKFPGVSLFAVFPGPLPAPQAFDELLATARRLADRLGCVLQDDSGSSLTGQRVLSLREDLVHFEHLVLLSRGSRSGA